MENCGICGGQEFYIDNGFYFCQECQTRQEGKREELLDFTVDPTVRVRKIRIRKEKSSSDGGYINGWTSWEKFNFILIGLTDELIELGADPSIKKTVVHLWTVYLRKLEVAFTSTKTKAIPRLARRYDKMDAAIIYGRVRQRKRRPRSRANSAASGSSYSMISSFVSEGTQGSKKELGKRKKQLVMSEYDKYMQSQESSDADGLSTTNQSLVSIQSSNSSAASRIRLKFNKAARLEAKKVKELSKKIPRMKRKKFVNSFVSSKYVASAHVITPMKLWALLYLSLRINNDQKIFLSDMIRYGREGHLSYYRLEHLLPPEVEINNIELGKLNATQEMTYGGMRRTITALAKLLEMYDIPQANLLSLIERYCIELQLPTGIGVYAERMLAVSPPKMKFSKKNSLIPKYGSRAMAFIIVIMKILFGLDGVTEHKISEVIDRINSGFGGCIAWDGKIMAGGTTNGGRKGKVVGEVGVAGLMGCGIFATKSSACAVMGQGDVIMKLGLARSVVEDLSEYKTCPEAALKFHLHDMLKRFNVLGGGIALQANGCFGVYFSASLMPYAIVKDKCITVADEKGVLESRLFSFCEWQRYIECRRCILVNEHFPSKLKYDPHSTGNSHLYVNFIKAIQSKYDGEEHEPNRLRTNLMPLILASIMKQGIERLADELPQEKEVQVFPPSLTPQHSYLQQLLKDPNKDIPNFLRDGFSATKIGYMIKPDSLQELAHQCDIELNIINAPAHFMEKIVNTFAPPFIDHALNVKTNGYNESTIVVAPPQNLEDNKSDDPLEYLHRKYPGRIVIDSKKRRIFNKSQKFTQNLDASVCNDFEFDQVYPNGKLKIPDSDDESGDEPSTTLCNDDTLLLSNYERQSLLHPVENPWAKQRKYRTLGGCIKKKGPTTQNKDSDTTDIDRFRENVREEITISEDDAHDKADNNPIVEDEIFVEFARTPSDSEEISIVAESIDSRQSSNHINNSKAPGGHEELTLFRPFKEYWIYRCNRSKLITPGCFLRLEKEFSPNFRWLLHECAHILEMAPDDLYEDVTLVEGYFSDVLLVSNDNKDRDKKYNSADYRWKANQTVLKKKWES